MSEILFPTSTFGSCLADETTKISRTRFQCVENLVYDVILGRKSSKYTGTV